MLTSFEAPTNHSGTKVLSPRTGGGPLPVQVRPGQAWSYNGRALGRVGRPRIGNDSVGPHRHPCASTELTAPTSMLSATKLDVSAIRHAGTRSAFGCRLQHYESRKSLRLRRPPWRPKASRRLRQLRSDEQASGDHNPLIRQVPPPTLLLRNEVRSRAPDSAPATLDW